MAKQRENLGELLMYDEPQRSYEDENSNDGHGAVLTTISLLVQKRGYTGNTEDEKQHRNNKEEKERRTDGKSARNEAYRRSSLHSYRQAAPCSKCDDNAAIAVARQ